MNRTWTESQTREIHALVCEVDQLGRALDDSNLDDMIALTAQIEARIAALKRLMTH